MMGTFSSLATAFKDREISAISVARFGQLFLWAASQGLQDPTEWAQSAWQTLQTQGQKLVHEGKTLDTPEANLAQLTVQAKAFGTHRLPVLRALQVVPGISG